MSYKCKYCQQDFKRKNKLEIHQNKKTPCYVEQFCDLELDFIFSDEELKIYDKKTRENGYIKKKSKIICIFCREEFEKNQNFRRHCKKYCNKLQERIKKYMDKEKIVINTVEKIEIKKGMDSYFLLELEKCKKIKALGCENLQDITIENFRKMISFPKKSISFLTECLNFNIKKGENWNFFRMNDENVIKLLYKDMKGETKWEIMEFEKFIELLFSIRQNQINDLERRYEFKNYLEKNIKSYNKKWEEVKNQEGDEEEMKNLKNIVLEGVEKLEYFLNKNSELIQEIFDLEKNFKINFVKNILTPEEKDILLKQLLNEQK